MKLLLVEDDPLLRRQIEIGLSSGGHAVEAVANTEDALIQLAQFHHDLALIDLGLAGMSGLELIRQVRARGHSLPILILSARCHWGERVEGLAAGRTTTLSSPLSSPNCKPGSMRYCAAPVVLSRPLGSPVPWCSISIASRPRSVQNRWI